MIFYAIKHIPTGNLMPQSMQARSTQWDPNVPNHLEPPRLFTSSRNAKLSGARWGQGIAKRAWEEYNDGYRTDIKSAGIYYEEVPGRNSSSLRIVKVEVREL